MTDNLQTIINTFWPIPAVYDCNRSFEEQREQYAVFLQETLGELYAGYDALCADAHNPTWTGYEALIEFVYRHGVHWTVRPDVANRARETFAALRPVIPATTRTIVDLGTGDGSVALALALTCQAIDTIYAVDTCEAALARMPVLLSQLPSDVAAAAREKVRPVHADYRDKAAMERLRAEAGTIDLVIGMFQPDFTEVIAGTSYLQEDILLLFAIPQHASVPPYMMQYTLNGAMYGYNTKSTVLSSIGYAPEEKVFLCKITP